MAARRAQYEYSQYANEMLNANTSLSGAGSAVEPAPGMDHLPDLDLNSPLGLLDMSPGSPRTVPSFQDFSFSSYHNDSFASSSGTHSGYQISSHPSSDLQHFTGQIQSAGVLSGSNQADPWNPLQGTPQELPIHTKAGGVPAARTPVRRSETSTLPPDSGYRTSSQCETQSHLSAPDMHTPTEMDSFMMNRPQADFTGLATTFQEHAESQHFEINSLTPQEIIQEQHPPRPELKCHLCGTESKTPSDAKKHANRHLKPNVCTEPGCSRSGMGFATPNDLIRHIKSVHTRGGKNWKCMAPGCAKPDKAWPRLDNFKQHLIRMHPECDAEDLVRQAEALPDFSSGNDEALTVINNVLHHQEDKIRQEKRQQSRRRTSTSTFTSTDSRQKRPAEELPSTPPEPQRPRPNVPTLNIDPHFNRTPTQNMRFLSPHSPNVPQYGTPLFGRHVTTSTQNRRRRPPALQRQSDPQQLVAQSMARSQSQQEPSSRRHTFGNGQQPLSSLQQYNSVVPNFLPTQQVHLSPEDARSAYEQPWNPQTQFTTHHYPHTVAGDTSWEELMQIHNDPMFACPPYSATDLPHHSDLLGDLAGTLQPASQQASVSPTITGNDPRTPPSQTQTPRVMFTVEQDRPPPDDIADIPKILQGLGNYKQLYQAIGNNPGAQEELSRLFQSAKGSSRAIVKSDVKAEASYMESPSQGSSKSQHQRQISSSSDATSPTAHQATKSATAAAVKRSALNKPNAVCPKCHKEVGRVSDLKKHMKRHTRPYGCVWDGCSKVFGSKNDWKRHELTHGEPDGGWHCDGHHAGQHGGGCQVWWPIGSSTFEDSMEQYTNHLVACGVAPNTLADVLQQCFIPKGWKKDAFWCGFCECVVHLIGEEDTYIEQRFSHIETHYMKDEPKKNNMQWKDCNGGGASKGDEPGSTPSTSDRGGASQQ